MSENKTGKYLKYAIGEIILVVIGILIALQVNNWNENRKYKSMQSSYLKELSSDIDTMLYAYKNNVKFRETSIGMSKGLLSKLKSCNLTPEEKVSFDQFLITYNFLGKLFQVRDTYEEMLSANLLVSIEDKEFKSLIMEFFAHRDAMMIFIGEFQQDLNTDYKVIKEYVTFSYNSNNQPQVDYDLSELCNNTDFTNAIFQVIRYRESIDQMFKLLLQKLERMQVILKNENQESLN